MKKHIQKTLAALLALLMLTLAFVGCGETEDNSGLESISLVNRDWKSAYFVGDPLSLDGLELHYYVNALESENYEKISLNEGMISGFSTSAPGAYKMKVTYKGHSEEIEYTVVERSDSTPLNETFCIGDGILATVDSTAQKVTVKTYANFFAAMQDAPAKTEAISFTLLPDESAYLKLEFRHDNSTYQIFAYTDGTYTLLTKGSGQDSVVTSSISPFKEMKTPTANAVYTSEPSGGKYYTAKMDEAGNMTVTEYVQNDGGPDTATVVETYTAAQSMLTRAGMRYLKEEGGYRALVMYRGSVDSLVVRKTSTDGSGTVYSATCTRVAE